MEEWWLVCYTAVWDVVLVTFTVIFVSLYKHPTVRFRNVAWTVAGLGTTFIVSNILFSSVIFPAQIPCSAIIWIMCLAVPIWLMALFSKFFLLAFNYHLSKARIQESTTKVPLLVKLGVHFGPTFKAISITIFILVHASIAGIVQVFLPHPSLVQHNCFSGPGIIPVLFAIVYFSIGGPILVLILWSAKDAYLLKFELIFLIISATPSLVLFTLSNFSGDISSKMHPMLFILLFMHLTSFFTLGVPIYDVIQSSLKKTPTNFALFQIMLNDPMQFHDFKEFTVSDFTIENPLFYEEYSHFLSSHLRLSNQISLKVDNSFFPRFFKNCWFILGSSRNNGISDDSEANISLTKSLQATSSYSKSAASEETLPRLIASPYEHPELKRLYDKYIAPGSEFQLNLMGSTVRKIKKRFEENDIDPHMLDPALTEVLDSMYRNSFVRYLKYQQH